ncbi:hypothetical protein KIN20_036720 [Parelaphostrongylus tenuis]|uniref:Uncharacterized protein n=1 Tax=Parelaphostrongylus tenuis TaxID=148309 RepID=A0AAD5RDG3_PARTN|nr:hypothetical protein KIN20_036720 [Parelaphostrongylus tenuis]
MDGCNGISRDQILEAIPPCCCSDWEIGSREIHSKLLRWCVSQMPPTRSKNVPVGTRNSITSNWPEKSTVCIKEARSD